MGYVYYLYVYVCMCVGGKERREAKKKAKHKSTGREREGGRLTRFCRASRAAARFANREPGEGGYY